MRTYQISEMGLFVKSSKLDILLGSKCISKSSKGSLIRLTHLFLMHPFYPLKTSENRKVFLMFSKGREMVH